MVKKKARGERTVLTYDYLWHNSYYNLKEAKKTKEGRFYNLLTSEVFACFSLEAFANHIGEKEISDWSLIERCLNPKEKFSLIAKKMNSTINFDKRPYKSLIELYKLRNLIVHGKTVTIKFESIVIDDEYPELPKTMIEDHLTIEKAQRYLDDCKEIIENIYSYFYGNKVALGVSEFSDWLIS